MQITKTDRIPELLHDALRVAMTGRRGPVFVEIPRDVLNADVPRHRARPVGYRATHAHRPTPTGFAKPRGSCARRERPLMLVGGGVTRAGASDDVVRLADRYAIPMITAYGRNDAVPNAHPLYVGPLGRAGSPEAAAACRRADLLLVLGSRLGHFTRHFDDRSIQPETKIVQVDVQRPTSAATIPSPSASRPTRARRVALVDALAAEPRTSRRAGARKPRRSGATGKRASMRKRARASPMKPQRVYAELRRVLPPDTIVALDAGAAPAYGYDRLTSRGRARS